MKKINPSELSQNPFKLIGEDWALITAGDSLLNYNTMTASWGGVGVLWNKPVVSVYIRPQRYTYDFMEKGDIFTLSFYGDDKKDALKFCGKFSGRDYDKAKECHLSPEMFDCGVAFNEAKLVFVCKKLYHNDINPQNFHDNSIQQNYNNNDYHRMYIGEILSIYTA